MTIAIQSITTFEKGSILDEVAFIVCSGFKSKFTNALFLLSLLSHKPTTDERYIDFITVSSDFRGQGIGKKLISYCKESFHTERLTLYVAKNNTHAYQLYQNLGFQVVEKENSTFMGVLTGIKEWYKMEWIK
ncbi:GNAT family N-acetyltransferase [Listeria welshimeri]|nr:GNAT family N-acetyltransferase [Listeria welshimeri]